MGTLAGVPGTQDSSDIPVMKTGVAVSSGNVANASAVATIAAKPGQIAFLSGFQVTAAGATAASNVNATITGLAGGTITYTFTFPTGAAVAAFALTPSFYPALQASAPNTAIVVTLPAGGAGNTNAAVSAQGFYLDAGAVA